MKSSCKKLCAASTNELPVRHLFADSGTMLSSLLASQLQLNAAGANELIQEGAVYVKSPFKADPTRPARQLTDRELTMGDYVRVYRNSRRFPLAAQIDWSSRIAVQTPHLVIVDKPAGLPSIPTKGNYYENVLKCMTGVISDTTELFPVHRLDEDTSGLLLFAKKREAAKYFNQLIRFKCLKKSYRMIMAANSRSELEKVVGLSAIKTKTDGGDYPRSISRFVRNEDKQFSANSASAIEGSEALMKWYDCEANVLQASRIISRSMDDWRLWLSSVPENNSGNNSRTGSVNEFKARMGLWLDHADHSAANANDTNGQLSLCELELQLVTGRTYQCRGQCQAIAPGVHLAGDNLYEGVTSDLIARQRSLSNRGLFVTSPALALQAFELKVINTAAVDVASDVNAMHEGDSKSTRRREVRFSGGRQLPDLASEYLEGLEDGVRLQGGWWKPLSGLLWGVHD